MKICPSEDDLWAANCGVIHGQIPRIVKWSQRLRLLISQKAGGRPTAAWLVVDSPGIAEPGYPPGITGGSHSHQARQAGDKPPP